MPFITKLDFSNNRQVKQYPETKTVLSGGTSFGVTFSALPTGPDLTTSGVTQSTNSVVSTFSGNSATTVYTWYDSRMQLAYNTLSAITPSNSAITQTTGAVFTANTTTTIDGNLVVLTYSGVSFTITPITVYDLGGGNYSGSVQTGTLEILSAGTNYFTGRTIWADVSGITRTERLIITNNPQVGYVWTCTDSEGMGSWQASSGGTSVWSAGTGSPSAVLSNTTSIASGNYSVSEGNGGLASGDYSHTEGNGTTASNQYSHSEGFVTTSSGLASHAEGGYTIANGDYAHSEGYATTASGDFSHSEGRSTTSNGDYSHAEGRSTTSSGNYSHAEGSGTTSEGLYSHAEGYGTYAYDDYSHAEGYFTTSLGNYTHAEGYYTTTLAYYTHAGGNNSVASGTTSFVHGSNSVAGGSGTIVLGDNITGTTNNYTYVESLNIKTVGTSAFANDIRIDANGFLTTNTSDERLKENINPLTNALDTIKKLNGVTYQWKDRSAGGDEVKLGFIAQQVNLVDPRLVFTNKVDGYMGIHVDSIIPLLVEAVKELSSDEVTKNSTYLETQTILAEDNDIQLNFNGDTNTALGGGIRVLHAMGLDKEASFVTDENGNWTTNNDFKPNAITIPYYTPTSSNDVNGNLGNITRDDNYMYIKCSDGWKRSSLESF